MELMYGQVLLKLIFLQIAKLSDLKKESGTNILTRLENNGLGRILVSCLEHKTIVFFLF